MHTLTNANFETILWGGGCVFVASATVSALRFHSIWKMGAIQTSFIIVIVVVLAWLDPG